MNLMAGARGCNYLPQGNAAIVGRDPLVPIWPESSPLKLGNSLFGQVPVLEAATAQNDFLLPSLLRDRQNDFAQRVMEPG